MDKLKEHSMACGYKYEITDFKTNENSAKVTVKHTGVAPIYYDAFVTVNGIRSTESLKSLQAGDTKEFQIESGGNNPTLTIECDHLVPGQMIEYDADLK